MSVLIIDNAIKWGVYAVKTFDDNRAGGVQNGIGLLIVIKLLVLSVY